MIGTCLMHRMAYPLLNRWRIWRVERRLRKEGSIPFDLRVWLGPEEVAMIRRFAEDAYGGETFGPAGAVSLVLMKSVMWGMKAIKSREGPCDEKSGQPLVFTQR